MRIWIGGFGLSAPPGEPYILLSEAREILFPGSRVTAACTDGYAALFLLEFNNQSEAYRQTQAGVVEINNHSVDMDVSEQVGFGEMPALEPLDSFNLAPVVTTNSDSKISGFSSSSIPTLTYTGGAIPKNIISMGSSIVLTPLGSNMNPRVVLEDVGPQKPTKKPHAKRSTSVACKVKAHTEAPAKSSRSSRGKKKDKEPRRDTTPPSIPTPTPVGPPTTEPTPTPAAPPAEHPAPAGPSAPIAPTIDYEMINQIISNAVASQLATQTTHLATQLASVTGDMGALRQTVPSDLESLRQGFTTELGNLKRDMDQERPTQPTMPKPESCPDWDSLYPWQSAQYAARTDEVIILPAYGTRRITDFETHPPKTPPPFCFMRLKKELRMANDRLKKEVVLFPREHAQTALIEQLTRVQATNSGLVSYKGSLIMFQTPPRPTKRLPKQDV